MPGPWPSRDGSREAAVAKAEKALRVERHQFEQEMGATQSRLLAIYQDIRGHGDRLKREVLRYVSADLILDQNHRFQFASRRAPILWI